MPPRLMTPDPTPLGIEIAQRRTAGARSVLRLANGQKVEVSRFAPAGRNDVVRVSGTQWEIFARNEGTWLPLTTPWRWTSLARLGGLDASITFKEIENETELGLFEELRRFHYRGGGGAGRTVPIIGRTDRWDLPQVLGFLELTSSMIASTARSRFFDAPFFESREVQWKSWTSATARNYSNLICRISRFVIHPELRGAGLASGFLAAAKDYAAHRWHYGGWRPRFLEITADMLRYYKFVDSDFVHMGETEGNEHRLGKDMAYLVKRALTVGGSMPQGGGGIMTLQRGYAARLLAYTGDNLGALPELVQRLSFNPASLEQNAWEALHRLNRRPKPSYICGLTDGAKKYVKTQGIKRNPVSVRRKQTPAPVWMLTGLTVSASSGIEQTSEGRKMQEAFGFVGSSIDTHLFRDLDFSLKAGEVTLVCGASGSGKSLLLDAARALLDPKQSAAPGDAIVFAGKANASARVRALADLPADASAVSLKGRASLERFIDIAGRCGLAEPQLLVRPIRTLSSGQKYRLAVAMAFLKGCDVLLIDNFCEPLDRYTASAVVKGICRLAKSECVAVLAATATYDRSYLLDEVDQVILLRRGNKAALIQREKDHGLQKSLLEYALSDRSPK